MTLYSLRTTQVPLYSYEARLEHAQCAKPRSVARNRHAPVSEWEGVQLVGAHSSDNDNDTGSDTHRS